MTEPSASLGGGESSIVKTMEDRTIMAAMVSMAVDLEATAALVNAKKVAEPFPIDWMKRMPFLIPKMKMRTPQSRHLKESMRQSLCHNTIKGAKTCLWGRALLPSRRVPTPGRAKNTRVVTPMISSLMMNINNNIHQLPMDARR